jgi:type IV fimbrial biogenesis protein FimT
MKGSFNFLSQFWSRSVDFENSFVGFLVPSVGSEKTKKIPSVCQKRPTVLFSGFTLIELMVVLALVALLAFIATPTMRTTIQNNRISTLTNELVTDVSVARTEAIRRSKDVGICASSAGTACDGGTNWAVGRMVFVDEDNSRTFTAGDAILRVREPLASNTLTADVAAPIVFGSRGSLTNPLAPGPQSLALCDDRGINYRRVITISPTGSVSSAQTPGPC